VLGVLDGRRREGFKKMKSYAEKIEDFQYKLLINIHLSVFTKVLSQKM